jgi:protocatechuate 3,4-dioxygenase beta subunit
MSNQPSGPAGRFLERGPTDGAAEQRVPLAPLRPIPPAARRSFVPWFAVDPGLRAGENDLTRLRPGRPRAQGEAIEVSGRICDEDGRPLRDTLVELWNANRWGRYTHRHDPGAQPLDPHFLGHGRTLTDAHGHYLFRTIYPGAYLARPDIDRWRPSHLHLSILGGSARLITQMFFAGDPHLARDPAFILLHEGGERHFGRPLPPPTPDIARAFRFDIVVGGRNSTYFQPG